LEELELSKTFGFEAAHFLPNVPDGHKCRRMHGHSFRFSVVLKGNIDQKTGWIMDFADLKSIVKPIIESELDHYVLNDVPGLENPTSEKIAIWLWKKIQPKLPLLHKIIVYETCTSSCVYRGPNPA